MSVCADQPNGRILLDQVSTNGYSNVGADLNVQGLDYTVIDGINDLFQSNQGINVIGGVRAQAGLSTTAKVRLVGGAQADHLSMWIKVAIFW